MKACIVYFSRDGENYSRGSLVQLDKGNTEVIAEYIENILSCPSFRIEMEHPYPRGYNNCTRDALSDQKQNRRPAYRNKDIDLSGYDVIFLGYPIYWSTMPMVMFTFLENNSTEGKTIYPFCTHEGSGFGRSISDLKRICPKATVKEGKAICGTNAKESENEINKWIESIKKEENL